MYASQPNLREFSTMWEDKATEEQSVEQMETEGGSQSPGKTQHHILKISLGVSMWSLKRVCYLTCSEDSYKGLQLLSPFSVVNYLGIEEEIPMMMPNTSLLDQETKCFLIALKFVNMLCPKAIRYHSYSNIGNKKAARKWLLIKIALQYWVTTTLKKYKKFIFDGEIKDSHIRRSLSEDVAQGMEKLLRQLFDIHPDVGYIIAAEMGCSWKTDFYNPLDYNLRYSSNRKYWNLFSIVTISSDSKSIQWKDKRLIKKMKNISIYSKN